MHFELIADNLGAFLDFAPYVASINDHGTVAFQATLREGGSGVFAGQGSEVCTLMSGADLSVQSHPDLCNDGSFSVYARLPSGLQGVFGRDFFSFADTAGPFQQIGPLGPTMNEAGTVAFRATLKSGESAIFAGGQPIAVSGTQFSAFHGLPVINRYSEVIFRADRPDGSQVICSRAGVLVTTGDGLAELGRFPSLNDQGTVAFCARLTAGGEAIFLAQGGRLQNVLDYPFLRSVLINNGNTLVFLGGQPLGIHTPSRKVLALGDEMLGSTIADLAANPVSLNHLDQLAIRLSLADGRQIIVRADL